MSYPFIPITQPSINTPEDVARYLTSLQSALQNNFDIIKVAAPAETPRYDDLVPSTFLQARVGPNQPTLTTMIGNVKQLTFAVNDSVYGSSEVLHGYKEGSDIEIHIHWVTNGLDATARGVKWQLEYAYANDDGTFGAATTTISVEETIPASTASLTHFVTSMGLIQDATIKLGTYIAWQLTRIAATGTAPTANPFGIALGFHVLKDAIGSRQRYVK